MGEKVLLSSENHEIYRDGDTVTKVYRKGFSKSEVLREAMYQTLAEELGILVPKVLGVTELEDGQFGLLTQYVEGKTLAQLMKENPDKKEEYLKKMVELQVELSSKEGPLIPDLKVKMTSQIKQLKGLNDITRFEIMTKLNSMPDHRKLCHGELYPENIIVNEKGWYVLDWIHAANGNVSADVARTYLLLALEDKEMAETYLSLFCARTRTAKSYVQGWLPLVAAAQLTKKRKKEEELLESLINICDID